MFYYCCTRALAGNDDHVYTDNSNGDEDVPDDDDVRDYDDDKIWSDDEMNKRNNVWLKPAAREIAERSRSRRGTVLSSSSWVGDIQHGCQRPASTTWRAPHHTWSSHNA